MDRRLVGGLLDLEDFKAQQTVGIELGGVWRHGRDNFALGLDVLVALEPDEVVNDLAALQFGEKMDALVHRAETGARKKK